MVLYTIYSGNSQRTKTKALDRIAAVVVDWDLGECQTKISRPFLLLLPAQWPNQPICTHLTPFPHQRAGDRHGTRNTPSPLTTLGTALTYTMPYGFPTFHPLRTSFCMFLSWSVSRRHSTSDDVPMGGGTPQRKIEKRHSRRTPVLHPVQKRCEPSKTSIGVRRLWFFYPATTKFHFEFFFEIYPTCYTAVIK